jgi:hypothetical protein
MGGADTLTGGANSYNQLYGDGIFLESSSGGNDTLIGGTGYFNELYGDAHGLANGICGNDRLVSAANTVDYMWGDVHDAQSSFTGGHDTFAFRPNNGNDYLFDSIRARTSSNLPAST